MEESNKQGSKTQEKSWIKKHPVWSGIIGLIVLFFVIGMFSPNEETEPITIKEYQCADNTFVSNPEDCPKVDDEVEEVIEDAEEDIEEEIEEVETESTTDYYKVTYIVDGDTLDIDTGKRVRLICIDTPEKGEYYYSEAKEYLSSLTLNQEVELIKDISETDRYDRLLRYIYLEDGSFVNEMLVENGYAKAYPYSPDTTLCPQIQNAEDRAKSNNLGIWAEQEEEEEEYPSEGDNDCVLLGCSVGTELVGSLNSDKYHKCSCRWAQKILPENLNCFESEEEAKSEGYVACGTCF